MEERLAASDCDLETTEPRLFAGAPGHSVTFLGHPVAHPGTSEWAPTTSYPQPVLNPQLEHV
jgi:hypothetical protein